MRRVYSQSYDSVAQRSLVGLIAPADLPLAHPLLARLRLDVVLSGQVVLTDAQVLDGPWFRDIDPRLLSELLKVPGAPAPFVVRSRARSLADAAAALLATDDGRVKPFEFSSVPEPARTALTHALQRAHDKGSAAPHDLDAAISLLSDCGLPAEHRSAMEGGWRAWSDAGDSGAIAIEPFDLSSSDSARTAAAADLSAELGRLDIDPTVQVAARDLVERFGDGASRTALYQVIGAMGTGAQERDALGDLTDRLYGHLFKHQHRADDFDDVTRLQLRPTETARDARSDEVLQRLAEVGWTDVELQSDFMVRLALADRAALQEWHVQYRDQIDQWRTAGEDGARHLKRVLHQLEVGVLAAVPMARVKEIAEMPFEELSRRQSIARYLAPGKELGIDEAVSLAASKLPVLNQFTRIEFAVQTARKMARRKQTNWHVLSTDFAVGRRWEDAA